MPNRLTPPAELTRHLIGKRIAKKRKKGAGPPSDRDKLWKGPILANHDHDCIAVKDPTSQKPMGTLLSRGNKKRDSANPRGDRTTPARDAPRNLSSPKVSREVFGSAREVLKADGPPSSPSV